MKQLRRRLRIVSGVYGVLFSLVVNSWGVIAGQWQSILGVVALFLLLTGVAGAFCLRAGWRVRLCCHGNVLLSAFCIATALTTVLHGLALLQMIPLAGREALYSALFATGLLFVLFWCGIICIYLTSVQLGIKWRVIGAVCGMIPLVNLVVLGILLGRTFDEVVVEADKERLNRQREQEDVCKTRYPLLLVHGVFFRDSPLLNYWGRIPEQLERNGATLYYGKHHSAASVKNSGEELAERIRRIVAVTGCEKVNIIAHSKGGLDCRYAMAHCGVAPLVASLTTVNTPHRGCEFADWLLDKAPKGLKERMATTYNRAARKLGDDAPDFLAAVTDLTADVCAAFDRDTPTPEGVLCRSIGSVMARAGSGKFPLNMSYHLVKYFDGENDGLVGVKSFAWGEDCTLLRTARRRGISHGDMIDLNRENIKDFDVREFFVSRVADLKQRGL